MKNKKAVTIKRNGTVDILKFVFSLCVAVLHFNGIVDYPNERFKGGYFAVEFFFLVSGYLFAKSLDKYNESKNIFDGGILFIKKKYFSVFPYQIFAAVLTLIGWLVVYRCDVREFFTRLSEALPSIFFIQMLGAPESSWLFHEWYISSMLIVMTILTPIILKNRKLFTYVAPLTALTALYFLYNKQGTLNTTTDMYGFVYSGNIRAFADISLGYICYELNSRRIFVRVSKWTCLIIEILCYTAVLIYISGDFDSKFEFTLIFALMLAVAITFSGRSGISIANNKQSYFLGKLSLPLYLCHVPLRYYFKSLNLHYGYYKELSIFIAGAILTAVVCQLTVDGFGKFLHNKSSEKNKVI